MYYYIPILSLHILVNCFRIAYNVWSLRILTEFLTLTQDQFMTLQFLSLCDDWKIHVIRMWISVSTCALAIPMTLSPIDFSMISKLCTCYGSSAPWWCNPSLAFDPTNSLQPTRHATYYIGVTFATDLWANGSLLLMLLYKQTTVTFNLLLISSIVQVAYQ